MVYIVIGGLGALAMIILFACEIHENNKRIENGEPPIRHHDMASASSEAGRAWEGRPVEGA